MCGSDGTISALNWAGRVPRGQASESIGGISTDVADHGVVSAKVIAGGAECVVLLCVLHDRVSRGEATVWMIGISNVRYVSLMGGLWAARDAREAAVNLDMPSRTFLPK